MFYRYIRKKILLVFFFFLLEESHATQSRGNGTLNFSKWHGQVRPRE